jgi:hypothetical protein
MPQLRRWRKAIRPHMERRFGGAWVLDQLWGRLGLGAALHRVGAERPLDTEATERVLFALVAQRAVEPGSKLAATGWVGERVAITGCAEHRHHRRRRHRAAGDGGRASLGTIVIGGELVYLANDPGPPPPSELTFIEIGTPASGVGATYIPDGLTIPIVGYTQVSTPLSP